MFPHIALYYDYTGQAICQKLDTSIPTASSASKPYFLATHDQPSSPQMSEQRPVPALYETLLSNDLTVDSPTAIVDVDVHQYETFWEERGENSDKNKVRARELSL